MELELDFKRWNWAYAAVLLLLALVGIGALGRAVTPPGERLLTWSEWQVLQARQACQAELKRLRLDAEALATLLDATPDPVRAQIVAEQILPHTETGEPALSAQRDALAQAALAVRDWAMGVSDYPTAQAALASALQTLQEASSP